MIPTENFPGLLPYLQLSLKLVPLKRKVSGNMFRHQLETFGILLEYGYEDLILLKASLIHDLIEDLPDTDLMGIREADPEAAVVIPLVREVSIRMNGETKEDKKIFLLRIMEQGSEKARLLKLADRISNLNSLLAVTDPVFRKRYILETERFILPYSSGISQNMGAELSRLLDLLNGKRKHS